MAQPMSHLRMAPAVEAAGIEWESLGKSAAELTNSALPYPVPLHTFRARVPGGWLVLVMTGCTDSSVTFLPDPFHEWAVGTLPPSMTR